MGVGRFISVDEIMEGLPICCRQSRITPVRTRKRTGWCRGLMLCLRRRNRMLLTFCGRCRSTRQQPLDFRVGHRVGRQRRQRSFVADPARETLQCPKHHPMRSRSETEALHAEALQLGNRRRADAREYVQRPFDRVDEPPDGFGVGNTGREQAIGAGVVERRSIARLRGRSAWIRRHASQGKYRSGH